MKWECALLQKWLPEYPDGDLPSWGKRWLKFHLARCSACQHELGELREVVATIEATPVADPPSEFWHEFSREMHLKLVQAAQEGQAAPVAASRRWFRLPYLLGAPAVAALLLYVAVQLTGPGAPVRDQALVKPESAAKMAAVPQKAPARAAQVPPHCADGTIFHGGSGGRGAPAGGGRSRSFRLGPGCGTGGNDRPGKGYISQKTASA